MCFPISVTTKVIEFRCEIERANNVFLIRLRSSIMITCNCVHLLDIITYIIDWSKRMKLKNYFELKIENLEYIIK